MFLLFVACAPTQAELYLRAQTEVQLEPALALCAQVVGDADGCALAVVKQQHRWDACERLVLAGECHFAHADELAMAGRVEEGLVECGLAAPFNAECDTHLIGALAEQPEDLAAAEAAFARVEPSLSMHRARPQFLRTWFRRRLRQGEPLGDEGCVDAVCRNAAAHERRASVGL